MVLKKINFDKDSKSNFYSRMSEAPSEIGDMGMSAHDMNEFEAQEIYGVEEENEVEIEVNIMKMMMIHQLVLLLLILNLELVIFLHDL